MTVTVQLPATETVLPQLLLWLKSLGFAPVTTILLMDKAAVPGLAKVIVWAALVVLRFQLPWSGGLARAAATATGIAALDA